MHKRFIVCGNQALMLCAHEPVDPQEADATLQSELLEQERALRQIHATLSEKDDVIDGLRHELQQKQGQIYNIQYW